MSFQDDDLDTATVLRTPQFPAADVAEDLRTFQVRVLLLAPDPTA